MNKYTILILATVALTANCAPQPFPARQSNTDFEAMKLKVTDNEAVDTAASDYKDSLRGTSVWNFFDRWNTKCAATVTQEYDDTANTNDQIFFEDHVVHIQAQTGSYGGFGGCMPTFTSKPNLRISYQTIKCYEELAKLSQSSSGKAAEFMDCFKAALGDYATRPSIQKMVWGSLMKNSELTGDSAKNIDSKIGTIQGWRQCVERNTCSTGTSDQTTGNYDDLWWINYWEQLDAIYSSDNCKKDTVENLAKCYQQLKSIAVWQDRKAFDCSLSCANYHLQGDIWPNKSEKPVLGEDESEELTTFLTEKHTIVEKVRVCVNKAGKALYLEQAAESTTAKDAVSDITFSHTGMQDSALAQSFQEAYACLKWQSSCLKAQQLIVSDYLMNDSLRDIKECLNSCVMSFQEKTSHTNDYSLDDGADWDIIFNSSIHGLNNRYGKQKSVANELYKCFNDNNGPYWWLVQNYRRENN